MTFDISLATSQSSINQLYQAYTNSWDGAYTIVNLFNLWYYTNTFTNTIVNCRAYYQYTGFSNGYWCIYLDYNTITGLYTVFAGTGGEASSTNNGLTQIELAQLTLFYTNAGICFPAGTPISTDQGDIPIDKIDPNIHTINNKKIVNITQTKTHEKWLICFDKNALGNNKPSQKTIMSQAHKVYYQEDMLEAYKFVGKFPNVKKIKYNNETLYNVLMEEYDKMMVNNLICETLHPDNVIAKLYNTKI